MHGRIKNIIFDLGGVLLEVDYQRPAAAFEALGAKNFETVFSQKSQAMFMSRFERGEISPEAFRKELRKYLPHEVTNAQIDSAWNSILGELHEDRVVMLKLLVQKGYRLFLLSNTNQIHIKAFKKYMDETFGQGLLEDIFEKVYFSSRIGMRKPTKKIFQHVLRENRLKPEETYFIDDSLQHVKGAELVGIKAHWLAEPETIIDHFRDIPPAFPDKAQ